MRFREAGRGKGGNNGELCPLTEPEQPYGAQTAQAQEGPPFCFFKDRQHYWARRD